MPVFEFIAEVRMHVNADTVEEAQETVEIILSDVALDIIGVHEV